LPLGGGGAARSGLVPPLRPRRVVLLLLPLPVLRQHQKALGCDLRVNFALPVNKLAYCDRFASKDLSPEILD